LAVSMTPGFIREDKVAVVSSNCAYNEQASTGVRAGERVLASGNALRVCNREGTTTGATAGRVRYYAQA
jgi:hypothetical protein